MRSRHPSIRLVLGKAALGACGALLIVLLTLAFTDRLQPGRSVSFFLTAQPAAGPMAVSQQSINLNTASLEELMLLPGIGQQLAGLIIEKRQQAPFLFLEDLLAVPGFGASRIEALRSLAYVELPDSFYGD